MKTSSKMMGAALLVTLSAFGCGPAETTGPGGAGSGGGGTAGAGGVTGGGGTGGTGGTAGQGGAMTGGSGGQAGSTSSSGGGGQGGAGGATGPDCSDPLRPYALDGWFSNPIGPYGDEYGGFFANRLATTFNVDTVCKTLIVGLATFSNPAVCELPYDIGVVAWSEVGEAIPPPDWGTLPTKLPDATIVVVADGQHSFYGAGNPDAHLYRFAGTWGPFKAGESVFVGVQLEELLCAVGSLPVCDTTASLRYRKNAPGKGWALLKQANPDAPPQVPDVAEQLVFGLEDCTPVVP